MKKIIPFLVGTCILVPFGLALVITFFDVHWSKTTILILIALLILLLVILQAICNYYGGEEE